MGIDSLSRSDDLHARWLDDLDPANTAGPKAPAVLHYGATKTELDLPDAPRVTLSPALFKSTAPAAATPTGGLYTASPNERAKVDTPMTPAATLAMVKAHWPGISDNAARVLTAQSMTETTSGDAMHNWNFGNAKTGAKSAHTYFGGTWEFAHKMAKPGETPQQAGQRLIDANNGAAWATDAFMKKKGWPNTDMLVFSPPHPTSRFAAFDTADQGMSSFVAYHQRLANSDPAYAAALDAGDAATAGKILVAHHYAATDGKAYARDMTDAKAKLDKLVSP